jgi:5S rRNA maturation endonuclease (ribonuclease M5)
MTAYEHLLDRARDSVKRRGSQSSDLLCPAHDDREPSLRLSVGQKDNAVAKCMAGCRTEDVMSEWHGGPFPMAALFDSWWDRSERRSDEAIEVYRYTDERAKPLFEVGRFEPGLKGERKSFLQRRPGRTDWKGGIKGVRRVLYRLPQVIMAVERGVTVYVVEGERDVHELEHAGCVATCNPMGAGKWKQEYAEPLAGADVVVVQDRDDSGRSHARTIIASLERVGCTLRRVEAAKGKDPADHLAAGLAVEDFVDVLVEAPTGDLTVPVIEAISAYQAITDKDPIRAALAVPVTAPLDGEPLWLQLVGGPSSGKSEAMSMLRDAVDGRIGEVTVAGLIGWTGGSAKGKPSGLLPRIGDGKKLVTITDFSTVLADSDRGRRATLFSFLRVLYDGHVIREINSAPQPLEWSGRLTVVSAVTPQIDAFSAHADALGPRWLYVRMAEPGAAERRRAAALARRHAANKEQLRQVARDAAVAAVEAARSRIAGVTVNEVDGEWIDDAAIISTLIRSDVPREGHSARDLR